MVDFLRKIFGLFDKEKVAVLRDERGIVYQCFDGNLRYYNYWNLLSPNWIELFIRERNIELDDVALISVFGAKDNIRKINSRNKIFFTGENISHLDYQSYIYDNVDLYLGFDFRTAEKYLRFPLWIMCLVNTKYTLSDLVEYVRKVNQPEFRITSHRNRFCGHVSSHDKNGIRTKMIHMLQQIAPVDCAGRFMKNTNELQEKYFDNKVMYLENYRFNLCPENSEAVGYTTEKIFQSIMAGCVPIYWGGIKKIFVEPDILNPDAFIYYEKGKEEQLVQKVEELYVSQKRYEEFAAIPPFKEDAAEVIYSWLVELERRLRQFQK